MPGPIFPCLVPAGVSHLQPLARTHARVHVGVHMYTMCTSLGSTPDGSAALCPWQAIIRETTRELSALTSQVHRGKRLDHVSAPTQSPCRYAPVPAASCVFEQRQANRPYAGRSPATPCAPSEFDPIEQDGRPGFVLVQQSDDVVETEIIRYSVPGQSGAQ